MHNTTVKGISVIFPCFNEKKNIVKQISYATSVFNKITDDYEIIIVDDGSRDESKILLERLACENKRIKVIFHKLNLGYGRALQSGFRQATRDLIFYTSMDNQYDINQINIFLPHLVHNDIIIGYRVERKDPLYRILISKLYNLLIANIYGLKIRDINCAFKLFRKDLVSRIEIKSRYFFIDTEILLKAIRLGYSVKELEVRHYPRTSGSSSVKLKGIILTLTEIIKFWRELHLIQ